PRAQTTADSQPPIHSQPSGRVNGWASPTEYGYRAAIWTFKRMITNKAIPTMEGPRTNNARLSRAVRSSESARRAQPRMTQEMAAKSAHVHMCASRANKRNAGGLRG